MAHGDSSDINWNRRLTPRVLESSLIGVVEVKVLLHFFLDRSAGHSLLFAVGALGAA